MHCGWWQGLLWHLDGRSAARLRCVRIKSVHFLICFGRIILLSCQKQSEVYLVESRGLIWVLDIQEVPTSVFFNSHLTGFKKKRDYI